MKSLPFFTSSQFYKDRFGCKLQKIPVTIASDCPNRMGLKGMETCIFCDEWGSSAYPEQREQELKQQLTEKIAHLGYHRSASHFLAYFQTYTSTFLGVKKLRDSFDVALSLPEVKGLVIGTRPDCISDAVINLILEYKEKTYVTVELGVQTFSDSQLKFLRRGHSGQCSIEAIKKIRSKTGVDVGLHLIFGLPGETDEDIINTALKINELDVQLVKLHNLHVLKNTPLETAFKEGHFTPVELSEYSRRVVLFLEHLDPRISIERLAALSSRWDELVAPEWTRHKLKSREFIIAHMRQTQSYQGRLHKA